MRPSTRRLLPLLGLCLLASLPAFAQPSPAAGAWDLTMNTPNGPVKFRAMLAVEGETLTGELKREGGGGAGGLAVKGTAKGAVVEFGYTVKFQDNDLQITMTGTVNGDTVKGTVSFGGFVEDEWSGTRAADAAATAPAPAAPPAAAPSAPSFDLSGTWDVQVETDQGSGNPTFQLTQKDGTLTGKYQGMLGEYPVTGTITGEQFDLSFKVSGQVEGTVTVSGTTDGQKIQGKISLAGLAEGTFTGRKK
ncbi:MAG: hypothetical protein ACOYNR_05455 [Blastocatellia bacterium]